MKEKVIECQRRWLDRCKRTMTTELTAMFEVSSEKGSGAYHVL